METFRIARHLERDNIQANQNTLFQCNSAFKGLFSTYFRHSKHEQGWNFTLGLFHLKLHSPIVRTCTPSLHGTRDESSVKTIGPPCFSYEFLNIYQYTWCSDIASSPPAYLRLLHPRYALREDFSDHR
jgi:hypothetical protein